jgi:hypothetical protein
VTFVIGYGKNIEATFGLILMTISVINASDQSMQHLAVLVRHWVDLGRIKYWEQWEEYVA